MFDIGWTEMLVVGVVAILFVGPKELPGMLRTFGRSIKKLRALAGDFQKQFDDALKDAELDGVKDTLNEVRNLNPASKIKDHLNPIKEDLEEAKKLVEDAGDFDPDSAFEESNLPDPPKPVKVDVEAALKRQREADAVEKAELAAEAKKASASKKKPVKKSTARKTTKKSAAKPGSNAKAKPKASVKSQTSSKGASSKMSSSKTKASASETESARTKAKPTAKSSVAKSKPKSKARA